MKTHQLLMILSFILISGTSIQARTRSQSSPIKLDTIYANEHKNVALFFPSPIRQGVVGSENFVFSFNRDLPQYFGLLQAKPGRESNLLVVTTDGTVYSYIIKYKAQISNVNYFIEKQHSIGQEASKRDTLTSINLKPAAAITLSHFKAFSTTLLKRKRHLGHLSKRKYGIKLNTENIVFDQEQLYFVFEVENKSGLDYDVEFLEIAVQSRAKGKRKSSQRIVKQPLYKHKLPCKVKKGERAQFVYVLSKFSLNNNSRVIVKLQEKNGERDLELKISHRFINDPN